MDGNTDYLQSQQNQIKFCLFKLPNYDTQDLSNNKSKLKIISMLICKSICLCHATNLMQQTLNLNPGLIQLLMMIQINYQHDQRWSEVVGHIF